MIVQGEQDREVVRVLVECALQERYWNAYYGLLATKLATHSKSHKVSTWGSGKTLTTKPYCLFEPYFWVSVGFLHIMETL
jgi:hypothetical protein